jgi:hypothetical protein
MSWFGKTKKRVVPSALEVLDKWWKKMHPYGRGRCFMCGSYSLKYVGELGLEGVEDMGDTLKHTGTALLAGLRCDDCGVVFLVDMRAVGATKSQREA